MFCEVSPKYDEFVDNDGSTVSLTIDTSITDQGPSVASSEIHSVKNVMVASNCEKEREYTDKEGNHSSSNNSDDEYELKVMSNKEKRAIKERNKKRTLNASLSHRKSKKQKMDTYSCFKKQRIVLLFNRNRIK